MCDKCNHAYTIDEYKQHINNEIQCDNCKYCYNNCMTDIEHTVLRLFQLHNYDVSIE